MDKQAGIKHIITKSGLSKKDWVNKIGISYTQLRKWLSNTPVNIQHENIKSVAAAAGYGIEWLDSEQKQLKFFKLKPGQSFQEIVPFDSVAEEKAKELMKQYTIVSYGENQAQKDEEIPYSNNTEYLIPIYSINDLKQLSASAIISSHPDRIVEHTISIRGLLESKVYASIIEDYSMVPLLKPGMKILITPEREPMTGNLVLSSFKDGRVFIAELLRNNNDVILIRYNATNIIAEKESISFIHRISWINV